MQQLVLISGLEVVIRQMTEKTGWAL